MHIKNLLSDFLYDKNYYVILYENNIYIYNYIDLLKLSSKQIKIKFENFVLSIDGINLTIEKLDKKELLIKGSINNIGKVYE